jgi:glycerol kinase
MMGVGSKPHIFKDFITTIMYRNGNDIEYGIEASIESGAGTLNWLKTIGFFEKYEDLNSLQENGGVVFYPTFGRIMSPFW